MRASRRNGTGSRKKTRLCGRWMLLRQSNPKGHVMGVILAEAPATVKPAPTRPKYEVADVFHLYGDAFRRSHCLTIGQAKVMRAIEVCRTAGLGGHVEECGHCAFRRPVYNSCRNRHCPKCQKLATNEWLAARQGELLPVGYFHNVF